MFCVRSRRAVTALCGLLGVAFPVFQAQAGQVALSASKDNTLYESVEGDISNGSGDYIFTGRTAVFADGRVRRAVIAFDVAAAVPAGATILDARITLYMSKTIAGDEPASFHRLLADWGEGPSDPLGEEGAGATALPGDATWLHTFFDTTFWSTPGGDFLPDPSATQTIGAILDFYTWSSPQLTADVQDMLDNPASNFGWILIGNESVTFTAKRFNSRSNFDPLTRPVLAVCFAPPGCAVCPGDMDAGGTADGLDISAFVACYLGGEPAAPGCPCSDIDGDGLLSQADVNQFVEVLLAGPGCCN